MTNIVGALIVDPQIPKSSLLCQLQLCDLGPSGPSCLSLCIYKLGQYSPHLLPVRREATCVGQSRAWLVEGHSVKHTDISVQWLLESLDIEDIIQPAIATMYNCNHLLTIKTYMKFLFCPLCNIEAMLTFDKY